MRKNMIGLFFLAAIVCVPALASAAINMTVTLSDGVTTKTDLTGFNLSKAAPAGANQTLNLIATNCGSNCLFGTVVDNCAARPCTRFFPSGRTTKQSGDKYRIQDITSTNNARIEKCDVVAGICTTNTNSLTLRGIKIVSVGGDAAATFTLTYSTDTGAFTTITSSSGNYAGTAKLTGEFRDSLGLIPSTCNSGVDNPCAQLSVRINTLTLNGTGSNLSTLVTASIPCASGSNSPCGSSGFWSPGLLAGTQFLSTDTGSVGCGTTCAPFWESTLVVKTSAAQQAFTLANSAAAGLAPDNPDGLVDLAVALGEPGVDVVVGSCSVVKPNLVTGLPPFDNKGRNQNNSAMFPAKFSLQKASLQPATNGFQKFVSLEDPAESGLTPAERVGNDRCSMSWVASPFSRPKFSQISQVKLDFTAFVTGCADSGNPLLTSQVDCSSQPAILKFVDCTACFRVEIQLVDVNGVDQGTLIVYLGSDATNFYKINHAGSTSPIVFPDALNSLRVDGSGMITNPQPCCISFAEAQKNSDYGKLLVKAITTVIDPGLDASLNPLVNTGNHLVTNLGVTVARSDVSPPKVSSSNDSMLKVGSYQPSCDWPPVDGLKIYIYLVLPTGDRQFALNVLNPTVDDNCNLTASVDVTQLLGSGTYEASVVANSAATNAHSEFVGGTAMPNPGIMILK